MPAPVEVTSSEIADLIDAIHIPRFDGDELVAGSRAALASDRVAREHAAAATSRSAASRRRVDPVSRAHLRYQEIKGLLYVRVVEVQIPPSKEFTLSRPTPHV